MTSSTHPSWKNALTVLLALGLSLGVVDTALSKTAPKTAPKSPSKKTQSQPVSKSQPLKSSPEKSQEAVFKPISTTESGVIQRTTNLSLNRSMPVPTLPVTKPVEKAPKTLDQPQPHDAKKAVSSSPEPLKTTVVEVPQAISHIQQIVLDRGQALLTLQFTDHSVFPEIQQKLIDPSTRVITVLFPGTQWDTGLLKDSISLQEAWSGSLPGLESVQLFQEVSEITDSSVQQQRPTARLVLSLNPSLAVQLNEVTDSLTSLALVKSKKNTTSANDASDAAVQLTAFPQVSVNLGQAPGQAYKQARSKKVAEASINSTESATKTPAYSIFQLLPETTDSTVWDGALKQAWLTFQSDRAELGLLNLKQFVEKSPDNALAQFLLATAYRLKGRVNESINAWSVFVEKYPQQKQAWIELATLYLGQKNWDKAEQTLTKAEEQYPAATDAERVDFWYLKARLLEARNQPESALHIYRDILKIEPLHSKALQRALSIKPDPILEKQRQFYEADFAPDKLQDQFKEAKPAVLSEQQTSPKSLPPKATPPQTAQEDAQTLILSQWLSKGLLAESLFSPRKKITIAPVLVTDWVSQPLSGKIRWVQEVQLRTEKARQLSPVGPEESVLN